MCRGAVRKAKLHLELNLARMSKTTRRASSSTSAAKQKLGKNVGPLLNEVDALMMGDTKEPGLLNAFFASVFTAKTAPQVFQTHR